LRIAIDATPLMKENRTGVARYVENLIRGLAEVAEGEEFLLCYRLSRFSRRRFRARLPDERFRQAWIQDWIHPAGARVVHATDGRVHSWRGTRSISTVHDVFSLESEEFATAGFRRRRRRRYAEIAESADRIICVSGYTRDAFWRHFPIGEDRFVVIPEGVEDRFSPEAAHGVSHLKTVYGIERPYVLFVGELSARKNVHGMLDAWEGVPADAPPLLMAGKPSHGVRDPAAEIAKRGLEGRVFPLGHFPDADLPALYAGAECLLFPSFLEGFPIVASDRGALMETTGGIRVSVDPDSPESIRDGVVRVLFDAALRENLRRRGLEWAALYRWPEVARRTLALYREVLR